MANTDAWRAPAGPIPGRRRTGRNAGPRGNARVIAEPAYRRLLAAEPLLKRSIPTLIVIFLVVVAAVRFLSLVNWHDEVERNAKAMLALARQAPDLAARTDRLSREIDLMAEHGLRFDEATSRAIGKAEARYTRSGRVALWVIALTLVYIAWRVF